MSLLNAQLEPGLDLLVPPLLPWGDSVGAGRSEFVRQTGARCLEGRPPLGGTVFCPSRSPGGRAAAGRAGEECLPPLHVASAPWSSSRGGGAAHLLCQKNGLCSRDTPLFVYWGSLTFSLWLRRQLN